MTSPVSGLVQTIIQLKELQQRDEAAALAREQFGLTRAMSQEQAIGHFQDVLGNLSDPKALLPHVGEFAARTGFTPEALTTIINKTAPSVQTTLAGKVAKGSGAVPDDVSAFKALAGILPSEMDKSDLMRTVFGGSTQYLHDMSDEERKDFLHGVLQNVGTGQSVGEAAVSAAMARMAPEELSQAAKVGAKIAPSAGEDIQRQLGFQRLQLDKATALSDSALRELQIRAMMAENQGKLTGATLQMANELVQKRDQWLQFVSKGIATATPEGKKVYRDQLNAYNQQLRAIAPGLYGPTGTIPLTDIGENETTSATSFGDFMGAWLKGKAGGLTDKK